jgi:hypothetical protein
MAHLLLLLLRFTLLCIVMTEAIDPVTISLHVAAAWASAAGHVGGLTSPQTSPHPIHHRRHQFCSPFTTEAMQQLGACHLQLALASHLAQLVQSVTRLFSTIVCLLLPRIACF